MKRQSVVSVALGLNMFAAHSYGVGVLLLLLVSYGLAEAALNAVIVAIVAMALTPIGGWLADRFNAAYLFLIISALNAVLCLSYGYWLFLLPEVTLANVALLAVVGGALESFESPNQRVLLSTATRGENRAIELSKIRLVINLARAAAPASAGFLLSFLQPQLFFSVFAAMILLPGVMLISKRIGIVSSTKLNVSSDSSVKPNGFAVSFKYLRFAPWVIVLGIVSAIQAGAWLAGFRIAAADYFLKEVSYENLTGTIVWGLVLSFFSAGMILGSFLARFCRLRSDVLWAVLFPGALAIPLFAFQLSDKLTVFYIAALVAGILFDFAIIYGQSALIDGIPESILGKTSSLASVTEQIGIAGAYLILLAVQEHSARSFILGASFTIFIATLLALMIIGVLNLKRRKLPPNPWRGCSWVDQWSKT